jgi:hypothetical protein
LIASRPNEVKDRGFPIVKADLGESVEKPQTVPQDHSKDRGHVKVGASEAQQIERGLCEGYEELSYIC